MGKNSDYISYYRNNKLKIILIIKRKTRQWAEDYHTRDRYTE